MIIAGLHDPVIPLFETAGKAGAVSFRQRSAGKLNTGVICVATVISIVAATAHCPGLGVKV